jgi:hypothetical protein
VFRAPTNDGGRCYAIDLDPPDPSYEGVPRQRGKFPQLCTGSTGSVLGEALDDNYVFPLTNGTAVLIGQLPRPGAVTLRYDDGRSRRMDADDGFFAVALAHDDLVDEIVVHGERDQSCRLDEEFGPFFDCEYEVGRRPSPSMEGTILDQG